MLMARPDTADKETAGPGAPLEEKRPALTPEELEAKQGKGAHQPQPRSTVNKLNSKPDGPLLVSFHYELVSESGGRGRGWCVGEVIARALSVPLSLSLSLYFSYFSFFLSRSTALVAPSRRSLSSLSACLLT